MAEDIKVQGFVDKLTESLGRLATLDVTTVCTDVSVTLAPAAPDAVMGRLQVSVDAQDARVAHSGINIATGDVKALLPKDFFSPDQAEFREFHKAQVQLSREIMETNVKLVGDVLAKVIDAARDR
ncbi:hypothetical protein ACQ5SO_14400 [Rhodovulum sp. DZ06]|uniref:hypothetical protein n=1 Tax=Rhodovulum sp. DZ06 TaxID=3425126 RepID=UPI003D350983